MIDGSINLGNNLGGEMYGERRGTRKSVKGIGRLRKKSCCTAAKARNMQGG